MSRKANTVEDFWSRVDIRGEDECWNWQYGKNKHGYGKFSIKNKVYLTHRLVYFLTYGEIPKGIGYHGICVCHKCDNRICCNPSHLFLGTHQDNMQDKVKKQRQYHPTGEKHRLSKLTESDIINIRAEYKYGNTTHRKLGTKYGVKCCTIWKIVQRITWKHVP